MPYTQSLTANQKAFLDMIAWSEIGTALLAKSDDGYNVLVGSTAQRPLLFPSYAAHPHILDRALNSTAAGRYQIIRPTWIGLSNKLNLSDFGPLSQDAGCMELLRERGALPAIAAGDIASAIILCVPEWASLPGSTADQHQQKLADLISAYTDAGGAAAGEA